MYYDTDTLHPDWERGWHRRRHPETFPESEWVTLQGEHYLRSPSATARPATSRPREDHYFRSSAAIPRPYRELERSDLNTSRTVRPASASRMTRSRTPAESQTYFRKMREWADADHAAQQSIERRACIQFERSLAEEGRRYTQNTNRSVTPPPWTRSRGAGTSRVPATRHSPGFFRDLGVCIEYLG